MAIGSGRAKAREVTATGPQNGWPIKVSIASVVVLCMLVIASTIVILGWFDTKQRLVLTAAKNAQDAGLLITERSLRLLEPAQFALSLLRSTSLVRAKTLDDRLQRLQTLSDVLHINALLSSVYVGYADGSFYLVRPLTLDVLRKQYAPPGNATIMVQSMQVVDEKKNGEFLFFDAKLQLLERRAQPDYVFDPRTRPWFQKAQGAKAAVFTDPYIFFTTQQIGLTVSQPSLDGSAVFGIDMVLDDLASGLSRLKPTPHTELAIVKSDGKVLVYPDMGKVLRKSANQFAFQRVDEIGVPGLQALFALPAVDAKDADAVRSYEASEQEWFGLALPFEGLKLPGVQLLIAMPAEDLLGEARARALRLVWLLVGVTLCMLPVGWLAGAGIGRNLDRLTAKAQRMQRFDFHDASAPPSLVREVNNLSWVMAEMGLTIETFLQISQDMATEPRVERMLAHVLEQTVNATRCIGGAVYLQDTGAPDDPRMQRVARCGSLHGHDCDTIPLQSIAVGDVRKLVETGVAELQVALRGRSGTLEGLLVLQHSADEGHANAAFAEFVHKLSGMLAVAIETRQLFAAQKALLDAVIRLMADAIDAKSPYTGGHCERVPQLAGMLIDHMVQDTDGPYAAFTLTEDQRYEFHLGAWLHDCGKVTSPEHIIDKSTKLETIYNRIHEVRMRFEVLQRDAELAFWKALADGGDRTTLQADLQARQEQLQRDFAFIARCNVGGEGMAEADLARLQVLAQMPWMRHFDNRLGLSSEELMRVQAASAVPRQLPVPEQLLANRPEHIVPWGDHKPPVDKADPKNRFGFDMQLPAQAQNMGELYNLSVRKGTLTEEDRFKINDHIVQTLIMLRSLPWPAHLARVPDIAATHHEKLDGKGYPRRLKADQLTLADRVMALADIFEALTAADRPYKEPKTLTESLRIMALMAKDQHLDAELFRYFLHSGLWREFAQRFMRPSQCDDVNVDAIAALLPVATR